MKRAELETKLKALGWVSSGKSGSNHAAWTHPKKNRTLFVPVYDLIYDSNAAGILEDAER